MTEGETKHIELTPAAQEMYRALHEWAEEESRYGVMLQDADEHLARARELLEQARLHKGVNIERGGA